MKEYSLVMGGANVDIQGFPSHQLKFRDSNPGKLKMSLGGVGRNIADNMTRLGLPTKLITALGEDIYAAKIRAGAQEIGLDLEDSLIVRDESSSTYLSILDENGDMALALADMAIIDRLDMQHILQKKQLVQQANLVVLDTNLSKTLLSEVTETFTEVPFILDTVSTVKTLKVKDIIGRFHTIKPNKEEAETLSGIKIKSDQDLDKIGDYFLNLGVKRVFITLNKDGVYYADCENRGKISPIQTNIVNATGAGDAFVAALAYCHMNGIGIRETAHLAQCAAILALSHEDTINPNMSVESIRRMGNNENTSL